MILKCLVYLFIVRLVTGGDRILTSLRYSKNYVKPVVVNGEPAKQGQVPYMVSIKLQKLKVNRNEALWASYCGGAIISPTNVLSAAHCFENKDYNSYYNLNKLRAVAGSLKTYEHHDLITDRSDVTQWRHVKYIVSHKDYNFPANDIALVIVTAPWEYNNYVGPIAVARANADYLSWCTASGFGDLKHGKHEPMSVRLMIAKLYLLSRWECSRLWQMNMDNFVCTTSAVSDVARGDSGGPLACKGTLERARETANGILVGVVSGKNFDKTTLFTRVSAYRDWIDRGSGCNLRCNILCIFITILEL